jgi:hypothetical protein
MQLSSVTSFLRAWKLEAWIMGPSARGSLKGTPSSMQSAPAWASAGTSSRVASMSGKPAVRKRISPVPPSASIRLNFSASLSWVTSFNLHGGSFDCHPERSEGSKTLADCGLVPVCTA